MRFDGLLAYSSFALDTAGSDGCASTVLYAVDGTDQRACCAKRVGQRAAQSGRKNGKPGFWPEVRFQGGALVRAADKGEPVG